MAPGARVQLKPEFRSIYRRPGASVTGTVQGLSPSGAVARVRMDEVADSFVRVNHVELLLVAPESTLLAGVR